MLSDWKCNGVIKLNMKVEHVQVVVNILPRIVLSGLIDVLISKLAIKIFKSYP